MSLGFWEVFFLSLTTIFSVIYIRNKRQTKHTILRNYPFLGPFRYIFERVGVFLRQYFFAFDREELPFNRSDRGFIYRAAKNINDFVTFGSTKEGEKGDVFFVNSFFSTLDDKENKDKIEIVFGKNTKNPYKTNQLFHISGMSYGAISKEAVLSLSMGSAKSGCWLNTGEGGLSPYHLKYDADIVFQIGTANYGVRDENGIFCKKTLKEVAEIPQVKMFEIKLSQGAKPGKGGILPKNKITQEIAKIRGIKMGEASISPNRHKDIENMDDLLNKIKDIRDVTQKPVGIKMVAGDTSIFNELFDKIQERGLEEYAPDFITLDGSEGGTGASPSSLMDGMGLLLEESLPSLVNIMTEYDGFRDRIKIVASGKLITPLKVAWALAAGADCCVSARGFMFSMGCVQAQYCSGAGGKNCPSGIATHNPKYTKGLVPEDKGERVTNYVKNMMKQIEIIAHSCGVDNGSQIKRKHARIFIDKNQSKSLEKHYKDLD